VQRGSHVREQLVEVALLPVLARNLAGTGRAGHESCANVPAMKLATGLPIALLTLALFGLAPRSQAQAQEGPHVQLAPFGGLQYGGHVESLDLQSVYDFDSGFVYGGTLDLSLGEAFRFEMLYSRQTTQLSAGTLPSFDIGLERYMVGIQEEKGEKTRYFGTALFGVTRFAPKQDVLESLTKPALGFALGAKFMPAKNVGLRFEARGFLTFVESGGGVLCANGHCLFNFNGTAFWQGDLTGGLILAF